MLRKLVASLSSLPIFESLFELCLLPSDLLLVQLPNAVHLQLIFAFRVIQFATNNGNFTFMRLNCGLSLLERYLQGLLVALQLLVVSKR